MPQPKSNETIKIPLSDFETAIEMMESANDPSQQRMACRLWLSAITQHFSEQGIVVEANPGRILARGLEALDQGFNSPLFTPGTTLSSTGAIPNRSTAPVADTSDDCHETAAVNVLRKSQKWSVQRALHFVSRHCGTEQTVLENRRKRINAEAAKNIDERQLYRAIVDPDRSHPAGKSELQQQEEWYHRLLKKGGPKEIARFLQLRRSVKILS